MFSKLSITTKTAEHKNPKEIHLKPKEQMLETPFTAIIKPCVKIENSQKFPKIA